MQPSPEQARMAFFILLVINILNYTDRSILSAVQTNIQTDFGLTDTELGLLSSSFLFVYGIATLPLGIWADRGVRKNIVALCVTIWSCATAIGGLTKNFIQLFLSRSVLGIGEAGYAPASLSMIGDYFPKEIRGRMLSIWSIGNLIGTAVGLAVGGLVAETLGWRWVFFIVGIPGLLVAFFIWRAVEPKRGAFDSGDQGTNEVSAEHGSLGKDLFRVAKQLAHIPTYWVLVVAFICSFFIVGAALAWIPTYVERDFLLSKAQATGIASGVLAGGSLTGTLAGGWLADFLQKRMQQGRMLVAAIAFLVGAPLTFLALSIHSLPAFITVFVFAIICLSLCLGPIQAVIQDITTPDIRSTAVGLALLAGHILGDASSPLLLGTLSDRFTPPEIVQALMKHQTLKPEQTQALGHALGQAFIISGPTCLFLAGIACLIGLKTVAKDMEKMQAHLHQKHNTAPTTEPPATHEES
jgi:MFS family permease